MNSKTAIRASACVLNRRLSRSSHSSVPRCNAQETFPVEGQLTAPKKPALLTYSQRYRSLIDEERNAHSALDYDHSLLLGEHDQLYRSRQSRGGSPDHAA